MKWTADDSATAQALVAHHNTPLKVVAKALGRTEDAVRNHLRQVRRDITTPLERDMAFLRAEAILCGTRLNTIGVILSVRGYANTRKHA